MCKITGVYTEASAISPATCCIVVIVNTDCNLGVFSWLYCWVAQISNTWKLLLPV